MLRKRKSNWGYDRSWAVADYLQHPAQHHDPDLYGASIRKLRDTNAFSKILFSCLAQKLSSKGVGMWCMAWCGYRISARVRFACVRVLQVPTRQLTSEGPVPRLGPLAWSVLLESVRPECYTIGKVTFYWLVVSFVRFSLVRLKYAG